MPTTPKRQRVAAYAVIVRDDQILLSRLSPVVTSEELWTLPGGGLDHGEDPRHAVVREVHEETGLDAEVSDTARVYSAHMPQAWRSGRRVDAHAVRIVYEGWVPPGSPEPRVVEVDGSTMAAAWLPLSDVRDGTVPVTPLVTEALADHVTVRRQRLAAYALVRRDDDVLLARISRLGHHAGSWTLPGGGVDHGEHPETALAREVEEECGVAVSVDRLLTVHDTHFTGTAPTGRLEDFHGIHLVYACTLAAGDEPRAVEVDGTTDDVAFHALLDIESGAVPVLDVVHAAIRAGA
ncbi:hypothetical protein GCM10009623_25280 [Nocardioides aestuarii]|uniref:NUDIX domain-containing protein n=1 Tax=Nocardioides aestuarii TaxID=252231 RepID=A0ABW4TQ94_9ACTN